MDMVLVPVRGEYEGDSGIDDFTGLLRYLGIVWVINWQRFGYRLPKGSNNGVLSGWLPGWADWYPYTQP